MDHKLRQQIRQIVLNNPVIKYRWHNEITYAVVDECGRPLLTIADHTHTSDFIGKKLFVGGKLVSKDCPWVFGVLTTKYKFDQYRQNYTEKQR